MNCCDADGHLVRVSFDTIKQAQKELVLLSREDAAPAVILQRIKLCELLLSEIVGIRTSLTLHVADARKDAVEGELAMRLGLTQSLSLMPASPISKSSSI